MINSKEENFNNTIEKYMKIDCSNCFGFCCVALYFSKTDGFPSDKEAGKPCNNLNKDFSCRVHSSLREKGLKGCTIYDCFGAGQKVAQITYAGNDWTNNPKLSSEMFESFLVVRNLHEMIWYLIDALRNKYTKSIHNDLRNIIDETEKLTKLESQKLLKLDIVSHRYKVNGLLSKASEMIEIESKKSNNSSIRGKKVLSKGFDYIGKDLSKHNLIGADFKGALMIACNLSNTNLKNANFIGADLRDANICGADLRESIFLTQIQINSAKGDSNTKLPKHIDRPSHWL